MAGGFALLCLIGMTTSSVGYQQISLDRAPETDAKALLTENVFDLPISQDEQQKLDEWVRRLGAASFKVRLASRKALVDFGIHAFGKLREAYRATDLVETRLAIEEIVQETYLRHFVFRRNAFLGISQNRYPLRHEDDARIQEGHIGIVIGRVISGTAAEQAGLRAEDVIVALDGEPIAMPDVGFTNSFSEALRKRRPGAQLVLYVLRAEQAFEVGVVLRARPRRYYNARQGSVHKMLLDHQRTFDTFWRDHFQETTGKIGNTESR